MKHVILSLDTSDSDRTRVVLTIDGKRFEKTSQSKILKAQTVLPLIEELMKEHAIDPSDISGILVYAGPGSFTGLRVGATIANTLGFLLHIPVNGKRHSVIPSY